MHSAATPCVGARNRRRDEGPCQKNLTVFTGVPSLSGSQLRCVSRFKALSRFVLGVFAAMPCMSRRLAWVSLLCGMQNHHITRVLERSSSLTKVKHIQGAKEVYGRSRVEIERRRVDSERGDSIKRSKGPTKMTRPTRH